MKSNYFGNHFKFIHSILYIQSLALLVLKKRKSGTLWIYGVEDIFY